MSHAHGACPTDDAAPPPSGHSVCIVVYGQCVSVYREFIDGGEGGLATAKVTLVNKKKMYTHLSKWAARWSGASIRTARGASISAGVNDRNVPKICKL